MNNITIDGMSRFNGGEYDEVKIDGMATCKEYVKCTKLDIDGTFKSKGKVFSKDIFVNGVATFNEDVQCENLEIDGVAKISGNLYFDKIDVNGLIKVQGDIKGKSIKNDGMIKIDGSMITNDADMDGGLIISNNLDIDNLNVDGFIRVKGMLNGDEINIKSIRGSYIKEIGGCNVDISSGSEMEASLLKKIGSGILTPFNVYNGFETESIEADNIRITNVKANLIRGVNIEIGRDCKVKKVEYSGNLDVHPSAVVDEIIKG